MVERFSNGLGEVLRGPGVPTELHVRGFAVQLFHAHRRLEIAQTQFQYCRIIPGNVAFIPSKGFLALVSARERRETGEPIIRVATYWYTSLRPGVYC